MTVTVDQASYEPGDDIVCTIAGHSEAPNACTINGVAATIQGGASSSEATVTCPAKSDFVLGGAHEETRFGQDQTLTLSFATEADDSDTLQIEPAQSTDHFYNASEGGANGSLHENGSASGDDQYFEVTSGTVTSIDTEGFPVVPSLPVTLRRRWFDVSVGSWSAVDTVTLVEGPENGGLDVGRLLTITVYVNGSVRVQRVPNRSFRGIRGRVTRTKRGNAAALTRVRRRKM